MIKELEYDSGDELLKRGFALINVERNGLFGKNQRLEIWIMGSAYRVFFIIQYSNYSQVCLWKCRKKN